MKTRGERARSRGRCRIERGSSLEKPATAREPFGAERASGRMDDRSDSCVLRASHDDPRAFSTIFERHYEPIRRYLICRLGETAGDELASEAFVRAFDTRHRYDSGRGPVAAWLFGIAANLIRRHRRAERRQLRVLARVAAVAEMDDASEVERRIDAEASRRALVRGLRRLRPADRETLLLFVWAELSYTEIAEALDIPVGTVRSRIARARQILQTELRPGSGEADEPEPRLCAAISDGGTQ
jgi:RNA polymerase sigma factor (sigma-70 family)